MFQRQKVAEVQFQQQQAVEKRFGAMGLGPSPAPVAMPPAEDTEALEKSLASARGEMDRLIIESSRFGDASGKAAEEATLQFSKLQQQFSKRLISPKEFEDQAKAISATLRKNLVYFSQENAVESLKKNREFFKSLNDLTKQAAKDARDASAGMVVGNTLFPSSDEIKKQADAALSQYAAELERIAQLKQSGALGSGPTADAAASIAVEEAQRRQKQRMDKIGRDTSFAEEIRKNLETAFLSPLGQYEKRLKEIQGNKSLTPAEKSLATVAEQKQLVESTFGKTEGQGFKDRQELIDKLSTKDEFGRVALSPERAGVEQRKLDADRRSAAGVENTPAQQLQLGIDKINSAFDATGKSMAQIQKDLGPEKFKEYQEALRKNRDSVLQSVGIERVPFRFARRRT
ncbi:hypothetical protein EBQ93_00355, partial [bacterium]|nr:hypothetical protein [bacterium]